MIERKIVVGTRGSALAQWQTQYVIARLEEIRPGLNVEIKIIKTTGDLDQKRSLADLGGLGLFTKAIEDALSAGEVDLAVHSLKDLPTEITPGLVIAAYPTREDPRDCIVSRHGVGLERLGAGARVGTSSARRAAQIQALRPDVQIVPLRGNVDTRLAKAQTDDYDAIALAVAGIKRLGKEEQITGVLSLEDVLPDPGQGALALQIRADDGELLGLLSQLDDRSTRHAVTSERAFLQMLGGGCRMPIGAFAETKGDHLEISGMVAAPDGAQVVRGRLGGDPELAEQLGSALAIDLLGRGAGKLLAYEPLKSKRVLITRAKNQAKDLASKISGLGGEPVEFPVIDFAPIEDTEQLDRMVQAKHDWIVFTSANGVHALAQRLDALGWDKQTLSESRLAAIGPATARALADLGLAVSFVPTRFLGEQIALELPVKPGESALLLRADLASDALARGLKDRGVTVHDVDAYRTIKPLPADVDISDVDAITFSSSSTVRNFTEMMNGKTTMLERVPVFCIGPVTAQTARDLGIPVNAIAAIHTIDGMLASMVDYFRSKTARENPAMEKG